MEEVHFKSWEYVEIWRIHKWSCSQHNSEMCGSTQYGYVKTKLWQDKSWYVRRWKLIVRSECLSKCWVLGQMPCLPESGFELSLPAQYQCSEVEIIYNKQINIKEEIEPTETFWLVAAAALGLKSLVTLVRAAERKSVLVGLGMGRLLTPPWRPSTRDWLAWWETSSGQSRPDFDFTTVRRYKSDSRI